MLTRTNLRRLRQQPPILVLALVPARIPLLQEAVDARILHLLARLLPRPHQLPARRIVPPVALLEKGLREAFGPRRLADAAESREHYQERHEGQVRDVDLALGCVVLGGLLLLLLLLPVPSLPVFPGRVVHGVVAGVGGGVS